MNRAPSRRAGALGGVLLLCMALIGVRLGYVQGVRAEAYTQEAKAQRLRRIDLPARRGTIFDRTGGELAVSVPARTVYANPRLVADPARTARVLARIVGAAAGQLETRLRGSSSFVYVARRIGIVTADRIKKLGLPGIGVLDEPRRLYPGRMLAANVIGFVGTDRHGLAGIEYAYEKLLGGRPGYRILEQDPAGRRIPQGTFSELAPVPGSDIDLTLHPDLQLSAERAMQDAVERTHARGGMLVALDPRTGEILAMVSNPTFDPNDLGHIDGSATLNRVVTEAYEPGSVNKLVVASAALNEGIVKPTQKIYVPGSMRIGDHTFVDERTPPGSYDLRSILAHSSNLGTIRLAQMIGPDRLRDYFARLGYGRTTGLGFPGESAGNVPPLGRWATALPTMAIGQGLSVTPLQIAQAYAMVANDGVLVEPRLVSGWVDPAGRTHTAPPPRSRRVLPTDVARDLRDMLTSVVADGTGRLAAIPHYAVAGKTGTARKAVEGVGYRGYFASFVGMFPAAAPRILIDVVLDDPVPIEGGLAAAPVFAEVGKDAARILRIEPGP